MKTAVKAVSLCALFFMIVPSEAWGWEIRGGNLEDVVVVPGDDSGSALVTDFWDGWYARGPNSFDVDRHGNIYILDWLGERAVKFDMHGEWISSFVVPKSPEGYGINYIAGVPGAPRSTRRKYDIAVDDRGTVYLSAGGVRKFSPDGVLLGRMPDATLPFIAVDKAGTLLNFRDRPSGTIEMFTPGGESKALMLHEFEYPDRVVTQKEVGNDIYFRVGKYLARTSLEDFLITEKLDTVAILPDGFRLYDYRDDREREAGPLPFPCVLIGFDKDNCFYFHHPRLWYLERRSWFCESHTIYKMQLQNQTFDLVGTIEFKFLKGKDGECSDRALWDFTDHKQFIVSGDGTIYLMHGTVDTVKVSKITFEPESH